MEKKFSLCPECCCCPSVTVSDDGKSVTIDDEKTKATLSRDEWNVLVRLIKDGQLKQL